MPLIEGWDWQRVKVTIYDILSKYAKTCHGIDSHVLHPLLRGKHPLKGDSNDSY